MWGAGFNWDLRGHVWLRFMLTPMLMLMLMLVLMLMVLLFYAWCGRAPPPYPRTRPALLVTLTTHHLLRPPPPPSPRVDVGSLLVHYCEARPGLMLTSAVA